MTKEVIKQLKDAGLTRKDFSVNVERIYRPSYAKAGIENPYDIVGVIITAHNADAVTAHKTSILAQGFNIVSNECYGFEPFYTITRTPYGETPKSDRVVYGSNGTL